ncbi:MAG: hypothetical protein SCK28_14295 [Bacillota bacterium]|nr:hypothetical protein [Bacillota bacterium]
MLNWIKSNLHARLEKAREAYNVANKSNNTYTMTGKKFVIAEINEILNDIRLLEDKEFKKKKIALQVKKEFSSYNLNKEQIDKLVNFIFNQDFSINDCLALLAIIDKKEKNQA